MKKNLPLLVLLSLLFSCTRGVITRNREGRRPREFPRQKFNGIKKKIVLLSFFNESPYGGEDLGITASENLRSELLRTGEFLIDPMGRKLFGSSKEIYVGGGVKLAQSGQKG